MATPWNGWAVLSQVSHVLFGNRDSSGSDDFSDDSDGEADNSRYEHGEHDGDVGLDLSSALLDEGSALGGGEAESKPRRPSRGLGNDADDESDGSSDASAAKNASPVAITAPGSPNTNGGGGGGGGGVEGSGGVAAGNGLGATEIQPADAGFEMASGPCPVSPVLGQAIRPTSYTRNHAVLRHMNSLHSLRDDAILPATTTEKATLQVQEQPTPAAVHESDSSRARFQQMQRQQYQLQQQLLSHHQLSSSGGSASNLLPAGPRAHPLSRDGSLVSSDEGHTPPRPSTHRSSVSTPESPGRPPIQFPKTTPAILSSFALGHQFQQLRVNGIGDTDDGRGSGPGTDGELSDSPRSRLGIPSPRRALTPRKPTLTHSARKGDVTAVKRMLEGGADVNARSRSGETPLFAACRSGAVEVVELLVREYKADSSIAKVSRHATSHGLTPLAVAAQAGYSQIVKLLVEEAGANPNTPRADGATPLLLASFSGQDAVVAILTKAGATLEQAMESTGATPLLCATAAGHRTTVQLLLDAGANANHTSAKGESPLFLASQLGHIATVQALLAAGASANAARPDGFTALHASCSHGHLQIVKLLIAGGCGAEHTARYGVTPVMIASQSGHLAVVKHLVEEASASVSQVTVDGRTPLWMACQHGHVAVARWLHEHADAEINSRMDSLATPLWIAAQNGHSSVVQWLIEAGCIVSIPDKDGQTPLFVACQNGFLDVAKRMHAAGALVDKPRLDGATPLSSAAFNSRGRVVRWLLSVGAEVNTSPPEASPILLACQQGHLAIVKMLVLDGSATLTCATSKGATPFWIACKNGHYELVKWLMGLEQVCISTPTSDGITPREVAEMCGHKRVVTLLDKYSLNRQRSEPLVMSAVPRAHVSMQRTASTPVRPRAINARSPHRTSEV